jgi:hypothetical protein
MTVMIELGTTLPYGGSVAEARLVVSRQAEPRLFAEPAVGSQLTGF